MNRTAERMENSIRTMFDTETNVACGTLICTYCEALGGHLRGCQKEDGESKLNFTAFVRSYLTGFMRACIDPAGSEKTLKVRVNREVEPPRTSDHSTLRYPEIVYKLFRCGFAHEYMPKYGTGIIRDSPDAAHPYFIEDEPGFELILNLTHWVPDFLSGLRQYQLDVVADREVELFELAGKSLARAGQNWDKRGAFLMRR